MVAIGNIAMKAAFYRRMRQMRLDVIKEAAAGSEKNGWVPVSFAWTGLFRDKPELVMERGEEVFTIELRDSRTPRVLNWIRRKP